MEFSTSFKLSQIGDVYNEGIDEEDSFFDLVLEPSYCSASKKDFEFIDSPILDKFLGKNASPAPISLRSTTKLKKVFILGFKRRSNSLKTESNPERKATPLLQFLKSSSITSKYRKAEDLQPVANVLFDNSLRSQMLKESYNDDVLEKSTPKYLKLIRPFYMKASKKAKVTTLSTPSCSPAVNLSQRRYSEEGRIGSLKIVARKLVRSRSTSAAVEMPPPLQRRDDMLMEQQDGIQAAILHCKKSYFSSCDEQKRFSI